jgi:hypothetical protein
MAVWNRSPFHCHIGIPDFIAHGLSLGLHSTKVLPKIYQSITICASPVHLLCIICDKITEIRYLKREGRLVKYKHELMYSFLRSDNNSKLNKFRDIKGE